MPSSDLRPGRRPSPLRPVSMQRVAVVAPLVRRRSALVGLAEIGVMEIDDLAAGGARDGHDSEELRRVLREAPQGVAPALAREEPDVEALREDAQWDLLAGEAALRRQSAAAVEHGPATVLVGWVPEDDVGLLSERMATYGASVVPLPRPSAVEPPTSMADSPIRDPLRPLVRTYAVVPYRDIDPSLFAGVTYVLMFGMMFGDLGHGLILAGLGLALARTHHPRLARVRHLWVFPVAAGLVAAVFGLLYGEAFGPTGLVPTLWLSPLEEPVRLLVVAVGAGAVLIAASYLIGAVNRWREGGPRLAVYDPTGIAGSLLFLGAGLAAGGFVGGLPVLTIVGGVGALSGLVLSYVGLKARAGSGGAAVGQAGIELFDLVVRAFANVVSFGRLAAFGLTHAAIGFAVWQGTTALWGSGPAAVAAVALFLVGNALAFALEGLVVGVQALRLEYYELFSRIFTGEGRLFEPWQLPVRTKEAT